MYCSISGYWCQGFFGDLKIFVKTSSYVVYILLRTTPDFSVGVSVVGIVSTVLVVGMGDFCRVLSIYMWTA